jgi:hypothetical protein
MSSCNSEYANPKYMLVFLSFSPFMFVVVDNGVIVNRVVENVIRRMEAIHGPFSPLEGKLATTSYRCKHLFCLFFFCRKGADRIKNKNAATDRIHKLIEEPMARFFSQSSPPPCRSPSPPKRKRDQILSPGGKRFLF